MGEAVDTMGEAVDTIPSILNKCLFVSPDGRTHGRTSRKQYAPHFFKVGGIKMGFNPFINDCYFIV